MSPNGPAAEAWPVLWSRHLPGSPRGLALAREGGWLLAWDCRHRCSLLDHTGQLLAARDFPGLTAAAVAEDGSACAAGDERGDVWWLAPDLTTSRTARLGHPVRAVALDPFGQYLAAADARGHLAVFDRDGRPVGRARPPRPLQHLAFVPAAPLLLGAADYGLVAAFGLTGETAWRVPLVANVGGLSTDGAGSQVLCACFGEGLRAYPAGGGRGRRLPLPEPCGLVGQSFDGQRIVAGGRGPRLLLLGPDGLVRSAGDLGGPAAALVVGALGRDAYVALAGGSVLRVALPAAGGVAVHGPERL